MLHMDHESIVKQVRCENTVVIEDGEWLSIQFGLVIDFQLC